MRAAVVCLVMFLCIVPSSSLLRYLYYGLNQQKLDSVGTYAQGTLNRYDLGTKKTVAVLEEPDGIQGLTVFNDSVYYLTGSPTYIKRYDIRSKNLTILTNLTQSNSHFEYPITYLRVTSDNLYWFTHSRECLCIEQSDQNGDFQESVFSGTFIYNTGFALDADNKVLYVTNDTNVVKGGFGKASKQLVQFGHANFPLDVDIDPTSKLIYYAGTIGVYTSKMDGTSLTNICPWQTCGYPNTIRLDPARGKAYYATEKKYNMMDLSGQNSQQLFSFDPYTAHPPWARGIGLSAI